MRDLLILLVFLAYVSVGFIVPFVGALGYIWVDTFYPQAVSYGILSHVPVSLIIAIVAVGAYMASDRRDVPKPGIHLALTVSMFIWVTMTCFWAVAPDFAWGKWNWASKTIIFSAFIPYFFRSRVQIEAFLLTWVFAAAVHIIPVGLKTMYSGGGYNIDLGVVSGNALLSEGSTLATVCVMFIPLLLWFRRHSTLLPEQLRSPGCLGYAIVGGAAALGTYARTALIAFGVLTIGLLLRSRRKLLTVVVVGLAVIGAGFITGSRWDARMETTDHYGNDVSALTRLAVWKWTIKFSMTHPFGGGYSSYVVNTIETTTASGEKIIQQGRAFHNAFIEMLGEQGYPGLAMFLLLCARTLFAMQRIRRRTRGVEPFRWAFDLAGALQLSLLVVMAGGCFVGISAQPIFWYVFAVGECMVQHMRRAEQGVRRQAPAVGFAPDLAPAPSA